MFAAYQGGTIKSAIMRQIVCHQCDYPYCDATIRITIWSRLTAKEPGRKIRGRARGIGSELVLAFDMRFASREKAIFGQPEIGSAIMPGGGGLERLPLLIGRARALEVAIGGDDFDADTAERYGWVNRALPDAELDAFVDRLALRIASFDSHAIAVTKGIINRYGGVPQSANLVATEQVFFELLSRPSSQRRVEALRQRGLNQLGLLELNLGAAIASDGS